MRIAEPGRALLLASLTAIVVFAAYRVPIRDPVEESAGVAREPPAAAAGREGADLMLSSAAPDGQQAETKTSAATARSAAAEQELEAMSDTFRNTTFLMAIRQAGYLCTHMLGVDRGADDMAAWKVRCSDALAYWVGIAASGDLAIDPVSYAEGFRPFVDPQELREPNSMRLDHLR